MRPDLSNKPPRPPRSPKVEPLERMELKKGKVYECRLSKRKVLITCFNGAKVYGQAYNSVTGSMESVEIFDNQLI